MKKFLIFIFVFLSFFVAGYFYLQHENKTQEIDIYALEESFIEVHNAGYTSPKFNQYTKGMTEVNVMFNFINYQNDLTNTFTATEIQTIMTNFDKELNDYFNVMSQGYVTINTDYCCYTSTNSYNYYLGYSGNVNQQYYIEANLFSSGVSARLDYNGATKTYKFNEYNVMVNCFAGDSGDWSSFLWPHAYSSDSLILMTETKEGYNMESSTLCHELLHIFGVMDLYAYDGDQWFTAQYFDMMCSSYKNLSTNAYFREKIGWIESSDYYDNEKTQIEEIPSDQKGSLTLDLYPRSTTDFSQTIAYKFGENEENNEFFVVEYRVKNYGTNGFDNIKPATAVIIYRVNTNASEYGNMYGNRGNSYYSEVVFMGNTSKNIAEYAYTETCALTEGVTHGNRGTRTTTSLMYSSGKGRSNLFNGKNSEISVYVKDLNSTNATIVITFAEDEELVKEQIDLKDVTWSGTNFVYNRTNISISLINVPNNITISYSGTRIALNVGTYTIVATITYDTSKYEIINQNFSLTHSWSITPALLTIKAEDKTSVYGETILPLTYLTYGIIYPNDNLNIALTREEGINVGSYKISCSASNSNYEITTIDGEYIITRAPITIKAEDKTSKYGESLKKLTHIVTNGEIYNNDNLNINLQKQAGTNKGTYTIYCSASNSNYQISTINGTYTISPRIIKVKVNNQQYFVEDFTAIDKNAYSIQGGSDAVLEDVNIEVRPINFNSDEAGLYELTATIDNSNYKLEVEKGEVVLTFKELKPEPIIVETPKEETTKTNKIILLGSIAGCVLAVVLIGVAFKIRKKRRNKIEVSFFEAEINRLNNDHRRRH